MSTINLRDFPEDLRRKAKSEAALMGISLKELIIKVLTKYIKKKRRRCSNGKHKEKSFP